MKFTIMLRSHGDTSLEYDPATCQFSNIVPDSLGVIKFMLEFIMQQGEDTKQMSQELFDKDEIIALLEKSYPEVTFLERKNSRPFIGMKVRQLDYVRGIYEYRAKGWILLYKFIRQ